jgi:hypothetical protein
MVLIRELTGSEAQQPSPMLCCDEILRGELNFGPDDRLTPEDFFREVSEWCRPRRETMYAILVYNTAVGTVTLSHRSPDGSSAQVGYCRLDSGRH